jgi:hypothetical protein
MGSLLATACGNDYGRGVDVTIINGLAETVTVTYEEPGHEMPVATLDAGRGIVFSRVFSDRGPACHGPFIARSSDGTEVDIADELCPGVTWTIDAKPPSHRGG